MFGILLAAVSSACEEAADSISKHEVHERAASFYTFGFLSFLFGTAFFLISGVLQHQLIFSTASLPTFIPRLILEILQAYVTIKAITIADRGDFGFIKMFTIPLLLCVDVALGYTTSAVQVAGMALIFISVVTLVTIEKARIRGLRFLSISAVNAVATISLYKYDISHFNSVQAEQSIVGVALMIYFFLCARYIAKENPFRFLTKPVFFAQSAANGLSSVASSFAYLFAPASIITTALRGFAVLFSLLSGRFYFREKHFLARALLFIAIVAGLLLLLLGA